MSPMVRNFDGRALHNLVEIKKVTDLAVSSEVARSLRMWATRVVEDHPPGQAPDGDLDMVEVDLLIAALGYPRSIEPVIENIEHALQSSWYELHGYSADIPWMVVAYDAACGGGKKGITLKVKVPSGNSL